MKPLKKLLSFSIIIGLMLIFTVGFVFTLEIIWRIVTKPTNNPIALDVALFPYKHYLVTTHPRNLELGKSGHVLESYFAKDECTAPDGITARFNSDGFRTQELHQVPAKDQNEIRIIITGGASAVSWRTGEACTLDNHLYHLFEKHFPNQKIRIFNLSNASWKSFQELLALQLYGLKLDPDLIIALDGYNDIQQAFSIPPEQPYANHAEDAFKRYAHWVEGRNLDLFKNFKMLDFLKQKLSTVFQPTQSQQTASKQLSNNQRAVDFYLRNERMMAKTASVKGAKIIFALEPTLYLKTPLSSTEREMLENNPNSTNFVVQGYKSMKQGLYAISKEEPNAKFYDMSTLFENQPEPLFSDSGNLNRPGNIIVANKLFEKIVEVLELN